MTVDGSVRPYDRSALWSEGDVAVAEGLEKVREAAGRYALDAPSDVAAFDQGYAVLHDEFGETEDIERYDTLRAWFDASSLSPANAPISVRYHMVLARDRDGTLAGIRDCFTTVDPVAGRAVVLLSHSLVMPAHRRTGLAALLRQVPIGLARQHLGGAGEILLAAEMEHVSPEDRDSVIRLVAYGRAGYRVVPPEVFPFAQPDFTEAVEQGAQPRPLPFLTVVRQVGEEGRADIPLGRLHAIVDHLLAIHACHSRAEHLAPIRAHVLAGLSSAVDPLPLLPLPTTTADLTRLAPLLSSVVLPLYPQAWRCCTPTDPPSVELAAVIAAWTPEAR